MLSLLKMVRKGGSAAKRMRRMKGVSAAKRMRRRLNVLKMLHSRGCGRRHAVVDCSHRAVASIANEGLPTIAGTPMKKSPRKCARWSFIVTPAHGGWRCFAHLYRAA